MHAFVPAKCAPAHEFKLSLNKVCIITNFTVKPYKDADKFRPVAREDQIILSLDTKIKEVQPTLMEFPDETFDF